MARRFNVPPGWPSLPTPDWMPPAGWSPDPSWPAPPPEWIFYTDEPDAGGRAAWVEPLLTVIAVGWVIGWLFLSGLGLFTLDSCGWAEDSARCGERVGTALLGLAIGQVSVVLAALLTTLRRPRVGLIIAAVGVPVVLIVFCVTANVMVNAG